MECGDFRVLAADYLSNELEPQDRTGVEEHRGACEECRGYLADLRVITASLRRVTGPDAPSDLWSRVEARITEPPARTAGILRFAAAACAAVLLVVVLTFSGGGSGDLEAKAAQIKFLDGTWAVTTQSDPAIDPLSEMLLTSAE